MTSRLVRLARTLDGWSLLLYLALACVATLPMPLGPFSGIPAGEEPAPALRSSWALGRMGDQLLGNPRARLHGNIFYPEPDTLAFGDLLLPEALAALPLRWLGSGDALAYNLVFLSSLLLSALGVHLLARQLGVGRGLALLAGMASMAAPWRFQLVGRLEYQGLGWVALSLWLAIRFCSRPGWLRALALGGVLAASLLSCLSLGLVALGSVLVFLPFLLAREGTWRQWRAYVGLVVAAALLLLLVAPFLPARLKFELAVAGEPASRGYERDYGPAACLCAPEGSLVYGRALGLGSGEILCGFPGLVLSLLALAGGLGAWRQERWRAARPWLLLAFVALVPALWPRDGTTGLLGHLLPPAVFVILLTLPAALLAAIGLALVSERLSGAAKPYVLPVAAAVMLAETLAVPVGMVETVETEVHARVASLPGRSPLVELPLQGGGPVNAGYMARQQQHGRPLVNGYGPFLPPTWRSFAETADSFPDARSLEALARRGARWLVLHTDRLPRAAVESIRRDVERYAPYVRLHEEVGPALVYGLSVTSEVRERLSRSILDELPPLPHPQGGTCVPLGEKLFYEVNVATFVTPATLRLQARASDSPDHLLLLAELRPTAFGRRLFPGAIALEDSLRREGLWPERLEMRLRDQRGIYVLTLDVTRSGGLTMVSTNQAAPVQVANEMHTALGALYAARCLELAAGQSYRLNLSGPHWIQDFELRVGGLEQVSLAGEQVACRLLTLEPHGGKRPALHGGSVAVWLTEDERRLPVKVEFTPPAGLLGMFAVLVDVQDGG